MYLENNVALIIEFFKNFFQNVNEGFVEVRPFSKGKPVQSIFIPVNEIESRIQEEVYKLHYKNDIFFGVSVRETVNGGKKENCLFLPALYIDIDVGSEGHKKPSFFASKDEAITHLMNLGFDPSIVVDSGNGLHVYWLLDEPLKLHEESISKVEGIIKRIAVLCGGDTTHDVSRILRVPYTSNFKSNPPKFSELLVFDYSKKINLDEFISKIGKNNLNEISDVVLNNSKIRKMIFNLWDEDVTDRSAFDQKIITALVKNGLSDEAICSVFNLFPTTGKYLERKMNDELGADQYLMHSIRNARSYISPALVKDSHSNWEVLTNSKYKVVEEGEECGYYLRSGQDGGEWKKLTNFVIQFNEQVTGTYNYKPDTYLDGKVIVSGNNSFPFERFSATLFASRQQFDEFLYQLCGVKIHLSGYFSQIVDAVIEHNRNIKIIKAVEFGYDDELTEYRTGECIIRANEIINAESPIMFSTEWRKNKVGFATESLTSLNAIKRIIIEHLFQWDNSKISLTCFSFVMLSLIYPFIKNSVEGKPYLLITGDSGSGKTTISRFYQAFFGQFTTLFPATSTATALNIAGHSMKDSLFCIDDLKISALNSDSKRNAFMSAIQNYSDGTSKNRANVNMEMREESEIRGLLMINGEDLVMTEASTIARGIILYLNKKAPNSAEVRFISESSKQFSHFTLNFIQFLLGLKNPADISSLVASNVERISKISEEVKLSGENLPRIINNLALLKTSWDISKVFLFEDTLYDSREFDVEFEEGLREILVDNFNRAHRFKADEKFEEILWTLIDSKFFDVQNADFVNEEKKSNFLGYFKQKADGSISLGISLHVAYKGVNDHLRSESGLGIQYESLKNRLLENGKIRTPDSGTVTIGTKQLRGVYWIGEIPREVLGIKTTTDVSNSSPGLSLVPAVEKNHTEEEFIFG